MSPSLELPGDTVVVAPNVPSIVMAAPTADVVVVPVTGPTGPRGPAGDSSEVLGYVYTTSSPAMVHQIHHGLPYKPGGITCLDADGSPLVFFTVTYPAAGITEVAFGSPVTPTIYLS